MARIKKKGLLYFPVNTDFLQNRMVRRIMKSEGDAAGTALLSILSCIYAGEGYYVRADDLFYDDLADGFYQLNAAQVKTIVCLAVEYELFDQRLFREAGILTSADIQEQYRFITRRRGEIREEYNLLPPDEPKEKKPRKAADPSPQPDASAPAEAAEPAEPEKCTETPQNSEKTSKNSDFGAKNSEKAPFSGGNKIKENKIKEYPLLNSSPEKTGRTAAAGGNPAVGKEETAEATLSSAPPAAPARQRREWTQADIDRLQPPADGLRRNLDGLIYSLRQYGIPPQEQYAIVLKTNFGIIGHPMWRGFEALRTSHGRIRQPGRYLLSLC